MQAFDPTVTEPPETDDQHGAAVAARHLVHLAKAFFLELGVADGEHLVDDQDLRLQMGGDGEGEAHIHARGIALDRGVEEFLDLGEGDDLVEFLADLGAAHAEDRTIQIDVLPPGQFGVKTGADLEQARDPAPERDPAGGRLGDAGKDFEQGRFAGAVAADDAEDLALLHLEADIVQRPKFFDRVTLDDLAAAHDIGCLAHRIAQLAAHHVA